MGRSFEAKLMSLLISVVIVPRALGCYDSIISFGDSITDTGNLMLSFSPNETVTFFHPPYGETYFHQVTGRCSDGRLIIDFIAEFQGLPLVPPYQEIKDSNQSVQNFKGGVNFAVVGATALDSAFFEEMGDDASFSTSSLGLQLYQFKDMLSSLCNTTSECSELLASSLILMGEIGGNDYNYPLLAGKSIEKVEAYVPYVIGEISSIINELIELGASTLLVPGNFPIGCAPIYLTAYETSDESQYNTSTGCINWLNQFSEYHNDQLQIELNRIQTLHPHVNLIYADYYNALLELYQYPEQFGFIGETKLRACCGDGSLYNCNVTAMCAAAGTSACANPAQSISWDGLHSTEATYRWIAKGLLEGKYTIPPISTSCVSQV